MNQSPDLINADSTEYVAFRNRIGHLFDHVRQSPEDASGVDKEEWRGFIRKQQKSTQKLQQMTVGIVSKSTLLSQKLDNGEAGPDIAHFGELINTMSLLADRDLPPRLTAPEVADCDVRRICEELEQAQIEYGKAREEFIKMVKREVSLWPKRKIQMMQNLTTLFQELAADWKRECSHFSSVTRMAMHPAYQRIIGMGPNILPLIFAELKKEVNHWFWALHAITGENPIAEEDAGNMAKMADSWLTWAKERNYA